MFEKHILSPFLNSIENYGNKNVLCINDIYYTYNDLAQAISKIRIALKAENIIGTNIGIITSSNLETYASIFAIWLEGGAYVPIDPELPLNRIDEIINQAKISLILTSIKDETAIVRKSINTLNLKFSILDLASKSVSDSNTAVILFTSGSTGRPKGVALSRTNMAAFVDAFWNVGFLIDNNDRFIQISDFSFDGSIIEYLFPFIKGGCVFPVPNNHLKYTYFAEMLGKYSITVIFIVPSFLNSIKPYFEEISYPDLRYVLFGGEKLSVELAKDWSLCVPNAKIYNGYGPTENTVFTSFYEYKKNGNDKHYNGVLSIGKVMSGGQMVVVDDNNLELHVGEKGELCLSGLQLTPGYIYNNDLNKNRFFIDNQGYRFYKTGDICFKDEDGDFLFCGRNDLQVKIQGIRIELEEIEFYARKCAGNNNVVAVSCKNKLGMDDIALFVEGENFEKKQLIDQLKMKMPKYIVISEIVCMSKFPLNSHGKTDRIALQNLIMK